VLAVVVQPKFQAEQQQMSSSMCVIQGVRWQMLVAESHHHRSLLQSEKVQGRALPFAGGAALLEGSYVNLDIDPELDAPSEIRSWKLKLV
jgi:hypothetical protein